MTLILPRRSFLTGLVAASTVLSAPGIVRASSLEFGLLRGWNLDPRVLAFRGAGKAPMQWIVSLLPASRDFYPADRPYSIVRLSETHNQGNLMRVASQQLPLKRHLETLALIRAIPSCTVV